MRTFFIIVITFICNGVAIAQTKVEKNKDDMIITYYEARSIDLKSIIFSGVTNEGVEFSCNMILDNSYLAELIVKVDGTVIQVPRSELANIRHVQFDSVQFSEHAISINDPNWMLHISFHYGEKKKSKDGEGGFYNDFDDVVFYFKRAQFYESIREVILQDGSSELQ